jgi:hypothetical protein
MKKNVRALENNIKYKKEIARDEGGQKQMQELFWDDSFFVRV